MAKSYRVRVGDATKDQLFAYLSKVVNVPGLQPATGEDKLRAKLAEMGLEPDDEINMPDDGEADREAAKLSRQDVKVDLTGDTITYEVVGYEKARDKANEVGGVLVGTDGLPLKFNMFVNWPKGKVLIPEGRGTDHPDGKHPVPVAVNGRQIYVTRGKDSPLAEPFIQALLDAEYIEYERDMEANAMIPRKVPRHAVQVKELPTYKIVAPAKPADIAQAA